MKTLLGLILGFGVGVALWYTANVTDGVREPWDGGSFWLFYAAAVLLSAVLGAIASDRAWAMGFAVVFAMLPVILAGSGIGPLIGVGLLYLVVMALPAAGAAELAFRLRHRAAAAR